MDKRIASLKLLSINGLGSRKILNLRSAFPQIEDVFGASIKSLLKIPGIDYKLANKILYGFNEEFVNSQISLMEKSPFDMVTIFDKDYPTRLRNIYDPPVILFKHGNFKETDEDAIAVVGTRKSTSYGKEVTEMLVKGLVEQNITIISGFARGIDTEAHKTALRVGGRTIAVLGNGIDRVYPPENRSLRNQIVENGVYCSEFPFGTKPDAVNFPRRNRIISGLSLGVLVIEAGEKSGAILTAYYGLDQNREVFAVPGRISDLKSKGTNRLIQKGAKLVDNVDDILSEIESNRKFPTVSRQIEINFKFEREEKKIYDALSHEPIYIDDLSTKVEKTSYEVLSILLSLELKGAVRQLAGKMFTKVG
ncbi:MAG: DNA-protecting protein DprA [Candidatus Neomarinimicrobiota bacterium]|nr:MAG: DNA-protecting protein DprA [Candidatus Neomarinimicrobiota bacterium]